MNILSLIESAHACVFNRTDMNKDVIAAIGGLTEAKTFLAVKPLHNSLIHRGVLSLTTYTKRRETGTFVGSIDLEKESETCAPVSTRRKRPSRSAKCRWVRYGHELGRLQDPKLRLTRVRTGSKFDLAVEWALGPDRVRRLI